MPSTHSTPAPVKSPIYLDYNATTPLAPAVHQALYPFLTEDFGNPSSAHAYGRKAHEAVEEARARVARLLGAHADEIVFTSGGTEANNHALKGVVFARLLASPAAGPAGIHVITSAIEHPATLEACGFLERLGCKITRLPVDGYGRVDLDALRLSLDRPTALVSIMHANNEVGTLQPIRQIAKLARSRGALVHTDAAQSVGKVPVDVSELGVDLLSLAGHKVYAPKGVGALFIRRGVKLEPFMHGAGHEAGRRAGTENVASVVGLGMACLLAMQSLPELFGRLQALRDRLWNRLQNQLGESITLNGHPEERLPNTLNVSFLGQTGADLLAAIPEIAASTGSACHEGNISLSPVLRAMGVSTAGGRGAVRLSVGRFTTEEEVDRAADRLIGAVLVRG